MRKAIDDKCTAHGSFCSFVYTAIVISIGSMSRLFFACAPSKPFHCTVCPSLMV